MVAAVDGLDPLRAQFRQAHCVRLPGLIDHPLLESIVARIEQGAFMSKVHGTAASELCLDTDESVGLLHFLVNDAAVYGLVEHIGECAPIRSFSGRVYRHLPEGGHYQHWHGDIAQGRRIGMSINL